MAFPASQLRLAPTLDQVAAILKGLKAFALDRRAAMLAGNVPASSIIDIWERLKQTKTNLDVLVAAPGLGDYAQAQYGNENLNIVTEYQAVITALDNVVANIATTFPADGDGYLLAAKFGASGLDFRQFTPANLSTLAGLLNTLAGTIS